jgi:hypothetical protein
LEKERATLKSTTMITIDSTKVPRWILPALRHTVALLLALSGPALMLGSLAAGMIAGSPLLGGLGLLGGALLTACGGVGLLWSLGRARRG